MININQYGGAHRYSWTFDHLLKVLTTGKSPIIKDPLVINAFKSIDRANFLPENEKYRAYEDNAIPIGFNESISAPTVAAKMISLLRPERGKKYLIIGSGSGYVAAIFGFIAGESGKVFGLERNQYIADFSRRNLEKYPEIGNIEILFMDGTQGLAQKAPFDFIYSEAAFDKIPSLLKNQLVVGGRMVAPTTDLSVNVIERVSPSDFDEFQHEGFLFEPVKPGIE